MNSTKTRSVVVYTEVEDSRAAGQELGRQISARLEGSAPDAVILFVSPRYDAAALVEGLQEKSGATLVVGCSSAGEFTDETQGIGKACAVALHSSRLQFAAGIGRGIGANRKVAAESMVRSFRCGHETSNEYCTALILTDALAGHADELIEQLTLTTGGSHQFFGGGAGDDANFRHTQVFLGTEVATDAAVALEIISDKPIGIGVRHGWMPGTEPMRVTESRGAILASLNATPILDIFRAHAEATGQSFDEKDPMPFFLHNILGIDTGDGYKLRVPLTINPDGTVLCAAEIPEGVTVCIMNTDSASAREAAGKATRAAIEQMHGHEPSVAIFFDCVATRLRMGKDFGNELEALKEVLGPIQFAGCNTYGQVARTAGQFNGFHNCTAVVCILPA